MAGATTVVKAVIEVKFDDLEKAQLALKKTGIEAVQFGKKAATAKSGTAGLTRNIGDLSEALDKKLGEGLARTFKATDRLQSIMGQVGAVVAVTGAAVAAATAIYLSFRSEADETAKALERSKQGLLDQAGAAAFAAAAVDELGKAHGRTLKQMKATAMARVVLGKAESAAAAALKEEAELRASIEGSKWGTAAMAGLTSRLAAAHDKSTKAIQGLADATGDLARKSKATWVDALPKFMQGAVTSAKQTATDIGAAYDQAAFDATGAFERWHEAVLKANSGVVKSTRATAVSLREIITGLDESIRAEAGPERAAAMIADVEQQQTVLEGLALAFTAVGEASAWAASKSDEWVAHAREAQKQSVNWTSVQEKTESQLQATGQAALTAGLSAAVYGDSVKGAVNDVLEGIAIEAVSRGLFEGAMGLGALALGRLDSAALHFASAAQFGAVGVAAGVGAAATGGFDGPSGGGGDIETEDAAFTGAGDTGQDRTAAGVATTTEVNVNLFAGSRPLTRMERAQMGQEIRGIIGA